MKLQVTIYGLDFASCFCNLLVRIYKARPLCSWGSVFGCESAEPLPNSNKYCFLKNLGVQFLHLNIPQHWSRSHPLMGTRLLPQNDVSDKNFSETPSGKELR
jgi:hypothetical protein